MKVLSNRYLSVALILFLFSGLSLQAQRYTEEQKTILQAETDEFLHKLMGFVEKRQYEAFGKSLLYTGTDPNRTMVAKLKLNDPHERLYADNLLNRIRAQSEKSALWHLRNFRIIQGGYGGDQFLWDMEFTTLKGKQKTFVLSLLKLKGEYLLVRYTK